MNSVLAVHTGRQVFLPSEEFVQCKVGIVCQLEYPPYMLCAKITAQSDLQYLLCSGKFGGFRIKLPCFDCTMYMILVVIILVLYMVLVVY